MAYGLSFVILPPSHWRTVAPGIVCVLRHGVSVRISLLL